MFFMKMKVPLRTTIVGNLNPSIKSNVIFNITNTSGKILVNNSGKPDYINEFIIDLDDFGHRADKYNLSRNNAIYVFILSCSLAAENILFSMKKLPEDLKSTSLKDDVKKSNQEVIKGPVKIISRVVPMRFGKCKVQITAKNEIKLDEQEIIDYGKRLCNFGIFESKTLAKDENIKEAIEEYLVALETHDPHSCYNHLYRALEKAVNVKENLIGSNFDLEASNLTGINQSSIKELRICYNRMKHTQKNESEINKIKECISNLSGSLFILKMATDKAILKRI